MEVNRIKKKSPSSVYHIRRAVSTIPAHIEKKGCIGRLITVIYHLTHGCVMNPKFKEKSLSPIHAWWRGI
jgi:hypothetical protein